MSAATLLLRASSAIATLHPASFAIVMATGIVSVACQLQGLPVVALTLLALNVCFYVVLWIATLVRTVRYQREFVADLFDHNRCVGFFTLVAATCVLGNQFVVVVDWPGVAVALWGVGTVLWLIVTYAIFTILTVKKDKPPLSEGLNGGWLVAVVAAQSVASLGALVADGLGSGRDVALFFSLVMWLGGGMLYIWIIALIFYRYTFFPLDPRQLAPPYWINMGAMAISTLAGAVLASRASQSPLLTELLPFIKGFTLLFWATATWWIPLLVLLGAWRHIVRKVPLTYDVVYWSAVFPLGMYTVCTYRLAAIVDVPVLELIPRYFVFIALAAWLVAFCGLLFRVWAGKPPSESAPRAAAQRA